MLEDEVIPGHPDPDFEVIVFYCERQARTPARHTQYFGLSYPMILDLDSQVFRRVRIPNHVFPLNLVIDRQGRVAHIGTELEDAVRAAEAALAQ